MCYSGVCGEFGWVRCLVVCFLYKTNPNPTGKNIMLSKPCIRTPIPPVIMLIKLFPNQCFSWVGIGFIQETDVKKPYRTKFSREHGNMNPTGIGVRSAGSVGYVPNNCLLMSERVLRSPSNGISVERTYMDVSWTTQLYNTIRRSGIRLAQYWYVPKTFDSIHLSCPLA